MKNTGISFSVFSTCLDSKKKGLPSWLREGLEKLEKEKQRKAEQEEMQKKKRRRRWSDASSDEDDTSRSSQKLQVA